MMERHFSAELAELKDMLIEMASIAEKMIRDSIRALAERDASALEPIDAAEDRVNHLQCEIDDRCTKLIALHQPTASDLRFILGCMKTNTDVERLADEAVNVSHKASRLLKLPPIDEFEIIPEMGKIASAMVKDGIHVYTSGDTIKAREVIKRDQRLNDLKSQATDAMTDMIAKNPGCLKQGLDIILAVRNLERIGDHVKNIAENAIFVSEGCDVRHHFEDRDE
jgi:phosphate transport system protein